MSVRGCMFAAFAAALVLVTTGCADNKAKSERAALLDQNAKLKSELDRTKSDLQAKDAELSTVRSMPPAGGASSGTGAPESGSVGAPGMGETPETGGVATADVGRAGRSGTHSGHTGTVGVRTAKSNGNRYELAGDILFASGSSHLKPTANAALDKVIAQLKANNKGAHLTIEGHTDSKPFKKGSTMTNEKLGLNRAQAVANYLAAHGIAKSQMTVVSKGASEPKSKTDEAQNRRVVIIVGH